MFHSAPQTILNKELETIELGLIESINCRIIFYWPSSQHKQQQAEKKKKIVRVFAWVYSKMCFYVIQIYVNQCLTQ